ncbi:hypothetical protein KI387_008924, partial [Taxus chinensis]
SVLDQTDLMVDVERSLDDVVPIVSVEDRDHVQATERHAAWLKMIRLNFNTLIMKLVSPCPNPNPSYKQVTTATVGDGGGYKNGGGSGRSGLQENINPNSSHVQEFILGKHKKNGGHGKKMALWMSMPSYTELET